MNPYSPPRAPAGGLGCPPNPSERPEGGGTLCGISDIAIHALTHRGDHSPLQQPRLLPACLKFLANSSFQGGSGGSGVSSAYPDPPRPPSPAKDPRAGTPAAEDTPGATELLHLPGDGWGGAHPGSPCSRPYSPCSRSSSGHVPPAGVSTDGQHRAEGASSCGAAGQGTSCTGSGLRQERGVCLLTWVKCKQSPRMSSSPLPKASDTPAPAPDTRGAVVHPSQAKTRELCKTRGRNPPDSGIVSQSRSSGTG